MEEGKTYRVKHSRKGSFDMKVTSDDGDWVSGFIVDGEANYLASDNKGEGESITVRESFCTFQEL